MNPKIYLAGSFYNFRDKIIQALPDFEFADPRKHRQHSISSLVEDDMNEAETSPILLACFPKGKTRGTMTYAEIGASRANGNYVIIADENERKDGLLLNFADKTFDEIDQAIEFLKTNKNNIFCSKFKPINWEKTDLNREVTDIFLAGGSFHFLDFLTTGTNKRVYQPFNLGSLNSFRDMDLTICNFPEKEDWDRPQIFYMGVSYALQTPIILLDEKEIPYPPLTGLARRIFRKENALLEYVQNIKSQKIEDEAKVMYDLFKKYDHI